MKIGREDLIEIWDAHCRQLYPREFCAIRVKRKKVTDENGNEVEKEVKRVERNIAIKDAKVLYNFVEMWDFTDVYVSVYAFSKWHEDSKVRKLSARVNTLFLDFDHENPKIAFKDAKKLVDYLINKKNIIPRVYFSGSKGFHVFIDFPEVDLFFKQETLKRAVTHLVKKLNLKCVDYQVVELARVSRLPLTINSKTGYRCTPINPFKFLKLNYDMVIHFCKENYNKIEVHESDEFANLLKRVDLILITQSATTEAKRKCSRSVVTTENKNNGNWRRKRIEYYAKVLREKGYLSEDPKIVQIHMKHPDADPNNPGSIEHLARVHLVLLMIEEGFTDEQIHEIFKYAKDYDRDKTQYYIEYNRKWLENKKKLKSEDPSSSGGSERRRLL